ncbi:hypothetical protein CHELA40_14454 [Chelatococcus asaccharovorans]|nr:hypothetical protein CHELA17_61165 [Chelatococcus asaccharovorans]CAH1677643.1 hypothetical protein CHELA40_14454 [Chelatococcus asaccharovorans]
MARGSSRSATRISLARVDRCRGEATGTTVSFRGGPKGPSQEPKNTRFNNTTLNRGGTVRCAFFSDLVFMGSRLLADARPRNDGGLPSKYSMLSTRMGPREFILPAPGLHRMTISARII